MAITKKHGTSIKQIDSTDTSYITSDKKEYKNQGHLDVRYEQAMKIRVCLTNIRTAVQATIVQEHHSIYLLSRNKGVCREKDFTA